MGIWVRSQNKMALINCKTFEIGEVEKDCFEILANSNTTDETYDYIGCYSSKEKALKVLGMLENYITEAENRLLYPVFNMPQDDEI